MVEDIQEQPEQSFDLNRILDVVRRRHVQFLVPLFVGWLLVWGSSWVLPARYKSSTLILVEQPTIPTNYVAPNINDDLQARLQSMTQQILSRTRLLMIIDKLHLYQDGHKAVGLDEKLERMRKDIDVELVRDPQNQAITAFRISYSAPDPQMAQRVTNELTSLFINENVRVREQESENTTQFIEQQLADARTNLAQQEAKVRAFQAAHEGELPTQEASNLQILSGLQAQLQNEQDALNAAKQQGVYYQSLVEQYHALKGTARTANGAPTGLPGIDAELDTLKAQLADLKTRYTDQYPDVVRVKAEIARDEKLRQQLVAELKTKGTQKTPNAEIAAQETADPAQNAPILQLESQLEANKIEISNRERAIAALTTRISQYQARLSAEPASEQELADLTRGYEQSQANYNDLLKRENDSKMATSMEQMQEGERFTMLDPPSLPLKPDFPNRLKMCLAGLGVGSALGLLIVVVLEFLDDRIYGDAEITRLLPIAIISEIPNISTAADEQRQRRQMLLGWTMAAVILVVIVAGTTFSYLHA